ncbi:hypothetical protein [Desulfolucanica intricata]|uniref:hypothetical protein n=1 Tax=Desulfolucanica intricata TaxID=1285191 RepID=UPI00082D2E6B|nr:hypothetical protein [Desulfolucanica intricata]
MAGCCNFEAPRVKKIPVGGAMVGLVGIDQCLVEVKELGLTDESQIAEELIERVKKKNYIPCSTKGEYAEALLVEYKKQFQPEEEDSPKK